MSVLRDYYRGRTICATMAASMMHSMNASLIRHTVAAQSTLSNVISRLSLVTTDSDVALIEMRYQQMLALKNLETLFAEGLLDCM
jgi:hypothetical protein